jgi:protein-S-isoprenylcysteine O-methyltransferase Ste14
MNWDGGDPHSQERRRDGMAEFTYKGRVMARAFAGLAALGVVLALLLFLPAYTLHFLRAWVYLGAFLGGTILVTAYLARHDIGLLARRNQAGPVAEPERLQQVIQSLASLFYIGMFVVASFDFRYGWSSIPFWLSVLADALVLAGLWIVFRVFRSNSYTTATIEVDEDQPLVQNGPYAIVRHPMYSGGCLLVLATPVALGSWWALLCAVPLILVIALRAVKEERLLLDELPGYAEYREKVRYRIVPHVW